MNSTFSHFTSNFYENDQEENTKTKKCVLCGATIKLDDTVYSRCADHVFRDGGW